MVAGCNPSDPYGTRITFRNGRKKALSTKSDAKSDAASRLPDAERELLNAWRSADDATRRQVAELLGVVRTEANA